MARSEIMQLKRRVLSRTAGAILGGVALTGALATVAVVPAHAEPIDSITLCDILSNPIGIDAWQGSTHLGLASPGHCTSMTFGENGTVTVGFFLNNQVKADQIGSLKIGAGNIHGVTFTGPATHPKETVFDVF
jgi:hypothetical protein